MQNIVAPKLKVMGENLIILKKEDILAKIVN